ncbi:hypothetical protein VNO78_19198 [Psophocarpus tetragonolobus]|uniref:PUM-HD domain-containing protein n=1 Tax=Psophocarpus tetragonolobus TaxID=3891 RepID=A0AAN9S8V1_PSOTE
MAQNENNHTYNNYVSMQQGWLNHGESSATRAQGRAFGMESLNFSNPSGFHDYGINHMYQSALHDDIRIIGTANTPTAENEMDHPLSFMQFQNPRGVGTWVPSPSRNQHNFGLNRGENSAFGVQSLASQLEALNLSNPYGFHDYMHEAALNPIRINGAANYAAMAQVHPHHNLKPHFGGLVSMAKDPRGSRFLQKKIDEATPQEIHLILKDLQYHLHDLIKHPFGHYVIEKFFQSSNISLVQLNSLIFFIIFDLQKLKVSCMDHLGNRVIQKILESVQDPNMIDTITAAMRCIAVALMKNFNGGYVLQQCLRLFPHVNKNAILDVAAQNCLDIARDRCGCCVIQNCLEYEGLPAFCELVKNIIENAVVLAEDPYGYIRLSMNKYASNVVEHLFQFSEMNCAAVIARELMGSTEFLNVVQHPYGNYVVQRALQYTEGPLHERLYSIIFSNEQNLNSCLYGKMVLHFAKSCRVRGLQNGV